MDFIQSEVVNRKDWASLAKGGSASIQSYKLPRIPGSSLLLYFQHTLCFWPCWPPSIITEVNKQTQPHTPIGSIFLKNFNSLAFYKFLLNSSKKIIKTLKICSWEFPNLLLVVKLTFGFFALSIQFFFCFLFFVLCGAGEWTYGCTLLMVGKGYTTELCLEPRSVVCIEQVQQLP